MTLDRLISVATRVFFALAAGPSGPRRRVQCGRIRTPRISAAS